MRDDKIDRGFDTKISVVGLGKLGLPLAACLAFKGFKVLGVDINEHVVKSVNRRISHIEEPGMQEMLSCFTDDDMLEATTDIRRCIGETDVTFIQLPTPTDEVGDFSNYYIEKALSNLGDALKSSDKPYHLFVISSTVMPGSSKEVFIPLLQEKSGRVCGQGFDICYNPDFVGLGDVIDGFLHPELVVIGASSNRAAWLLEDIHAKLHRGVKHVPVFSISLPSAELAKVALNFYVTMKISYANLLGWISERMDGVNIDDVTFAIGQDSRIGRKYLKSGLPFGGTCFPRDVIAIRRLLSDLGIECELPWEIHHLNMNTMYRLEILVLRALEIVDKEKARVAILGVTFKPGADSCSASPSIKMVKFLQNLVDNEQVEILMYDPIAHDVAPHTLTECLQADVVMLMHRDIDMVRKVQAMEPKKKVVIIDPWRQVYGNTVSTNVKVLALGRKDIDG